MGAVLVDVIVRPQPQLYGSEVVNIIALAILYYDFILTTRLEVEQFWGRRLSWASVSSF
ncbi:hypothetical protein C8Q74DRAFT_1309275 [Fomes fomentarius]|nr:hypothetical protein C8Q74DRAFT_1309275 [Fomes fomentarius]